eukprot:7539561-Alexandrium_andersonii.AAC.1
MLPSAVQGKALAAALYGAQVAPVSQDALRKLRTAVVRAIDAKAASNRDVALALGCTIVDLDPAAAVVVMRCQLARRMWAKHEHLRGTMQRILCESRRLGVPGATAMVSDVRAEQSCEGPIALLLNSLAGC